MAQFDAQNGFIQYIFANEDVYILDSMARENLSDYLYYQFRKKHSDDYQYIYQISGLRPAYAVKTADQESFMTASKAKQGIFRLRRPPVYDGMPIMMEGEQLRKLLRESARSAFIFRLDTFRDLFDRNVRYLAEIARNSPHTGNRIFLLCNTAASGSMPSFMDKDSVFRSGFEAKQVFGDIDKCFKEGDTSGNSYRDLKRLRRDGVVFLNDFSEENIGRVVRYVLWDSGLDAQVRPDKERQVVRFLYNWFHSPQMKSVYRDIVSSNEERSFEVLAEEVRRRWPTLVSATDEYDEFTERYDFVEDLYIYSDDDNVKRLSSVRFPRERLTQQSDAYVRWRTCLRDMMKPKCVIPSEQVRGLVADSIGELDTVLYDNDLETFDRICRFIEYYNSSSNVGDEGEHEVWESYRILVEFSQANFRLGKEIREEEHTIRKWESELSELIDTVEKGSLGVEGVQANLEKQRAVSLDDRIEKQKLKYQHDLTRKTSIQTNMENLELTLQSYRPDSLSGLQSRLSSCLRTMERLRDRSESEQEALRVSGNRLDSLLYAGDNETMDNKFDRIADRYKKGTGLEDLPKKVDLEPVKQEPEKVPNLFDLL